MEDNKYYRLSKVEQERLKRHDMREGEDDRYALRHPNRQPNSRRAMRNLVRKQNLRRTGHYSGRLKEGEEERPAPVRPNRFVREAYRGSRRSDEREEGRRNMRPMRDSRRELPSSQLSRSQS